MNILPHNQKAFEAVMQSFDGGSQRAAVIHATGTGKSYVIAAVASRFTNTLVVTPRDFIIEDMRKVFNDNDIDSPRTFRTYASLLFNDHALKGFDLIVLDEFHHTGAKEWGRGVAELIADNPDAKILGTSATPVRYSDHGRNMADDLFDGNVVSELTLDQAIGTILPVPVYVRSIWDFDETERIIVDSIIHAKRTNEWKKTNADIVRRQCLDWKQSRGVPAIIKKYLKRDMRHIIMFAPNIAEGERMRAMMTLWMHAAGFEDVEFFEINSDVNNVGKVMQEYKTDNGHTMHIAIAVNMLNEGVHIEGVDCVIMLRNTKSLTIVEQQLGRCLTASSKKSPLVLDFVNNITLVYSFKRTHSASVEVEDGTDEDTPLFNSESTVRFEAVKLPFKIIDECMELDKLIKSVSRNLAGYTIEELKEIASKYKTRTEWKNSEDNKSYRYASNKGLLAEVSAHMGPMRKMWTHEECVAIASKYKTRKDFYTSSPLCYAKMIREGWLTDNMAPTMQQKYTKESVIALALKCKSRVQFKREYPAAYGATLRNGWTDEVFVHLPLKKTWKDLTYQDFLDTVARCSSRSEFISKYPAVYKRATLENWITEDILSSNQVKSGMTDEQVIAEAKKYDSISSLYKENRKLYDMAKHRNVFVDIFPDYKPKLRRMTLEIMLQRASQYDTYTDFIHAEPTSAQTCGRKKWTQIIKEYFNKR